MSRKIIVVVGATGLQGSSVAKTFLTAGNWHVRCMTRSPQSSKAQELKRLGAELCQADLSDNASVVKAFDNANAIYANTDFWSVYYDPATPKKASAAGRSVGEYSFDVEVAHGKTIADAAAGISSLERFIYSGLPAMNKDPGDKFADCFHWDAKGVTINYIESKPDLKSKLSIIYIAAYATNPFIIPKWEKRSNSYKIMMPMRPESYLPVIDTANSTGPYVKALVDSEPVGTKLLAYDTDSFLEVKKFAELWTKSTGVEVSYDNASPAYLAEEYGIPMEILAGPILIDRHSYMHGVDNFIEPHQLKTKVQTPSYEMWLRSHWQELLPDARA